MLDPVEKLVDTRRPQILPYRAHHRSRRLFRVCSILLALGFLAAAVFERHRLQIYWLFYGELWDARRNTATEQFDNALLSIDRARLVMCLDPASFQPLEIKLMRWQVENMESKLTRVRERHRLNHPPDPELADRIIRERVCTFSRSGTIHDLTCTMNRLMQSGDYISALQTSDQILLLDPHNWESAEVHEFIRSRIIDPIAQS